MKKWNVKLIRVYETTAEVEVQAENEQDAIQMAEDILSQEEESWSDYEKIDQHVESIKTI
tara:strand:- start:26 stop:205 length:180 start_codon:yes stop_codon:yes gene_type:complete